MKYPVRRCGAVALFVLAFVLPCGVSLAQSEQGDDAEAPDRKVVWSAGPGNFALGDQATIKLPPGFVFADGDNTRLIMSRLGNPINDREVGLVAPSTGRGDWFLVFEFHPVGYVSDEDRSAIDADALLEAIREGTEEANAYRKAQGFSTVRIVGWLNPPSYDPLTNNLSWAVSARDESVSDAQFVNYNVRILGREGFLSVTLVTNSKSFRADRRHAQPILSGVTYNAGRRYGEYRSGDKLAGYGLTALIAGGAGAAAAKLGLFASLGKFFAKAGKAILVFLAAAFAAVARFFRSIFGKKEPDQTV